MRGFRFLPLVLFAGLFWFLFVSEKGSVWLASIISKDEKSGPVVGKVVSASGPFKRVHGGAVDEYTKLEQPLEIIDGNRLETPKGTRLTIVLASQDEIEAGELSAFSIQQWNAKDPSSPLYVQWMNGELVSKKVGPRGRAYIVRDGRLYFPGQKHSEKALALTVLRSAPLDMQLADASQGTDEFEADNSDTSTASAAAPAEFGAEPETLSNEYIDEMIVARQGQLQKCWITRLKDQPNQRGQITVQFEITRRGKIRDLRVTDSTLDDEALKRCVLNVVERITFRSFKGQEISLSYPINFE